MPEPATPDADTARPSGDQPPELLVAYRASVGVATWRRRHAESPVPSRWPYGLDRLADHTPGVDSRDVPALGGLAARLPGLAMRRRPAGPGSPAVALAWDELSAVDMLAAVRAERYYAGVIWATDAVAAGERTGQLRLMARALRRLDGLWVLSRPQAAAVRDWLGRDCPPVHFLRFGVDPDFYAEQPLPEQPHVVSVGGDRDRDPETLFAALELVRRARPDVRVTVQSRSDVTPPAGVHKVERLPHVEVARLLASATVVALATRPNLHASGMTVGLEAQSVGRPVVACDTPGMRDYFVDGETARLVPPRDPEAMAAQVLALLEDRDQAAALGRAGRARVLAAHSVSTMCAELAVIAAGRALPA